VIVLFALLHALLAENVQKLIRFAIIHHKLIILPDFALVANKINFSLNSLMIYPQFSIMFKTKEECKKKKR